MDSKLVRQILTNLLSNAIKYTLGDNPEIGLQMAIEQQPNLSICDVMMPELDGYRVITSLRQNPVTVGTPFIFLSAKATDEDRQKGLQLGANEYLTKPFTPEDICKAIESISIES